MHGVSAFAFLCFESSSSMVTLASIEEWLSYVEGCGLCFPSQVVQQGWFWRISRTPKRIGHKLGAGSEYHDRLESAVSSYGKARALASARRLTWLRPKLGSCARERKRANLDEEVISPRCSSGAQGYFVSTESRTK